MGGGGVIVVTNVPFNTGTHYISRAKIGVHHGSSSVKARCIICLKPSSRVGRGVRSVAHGSQHGEFYRAT